MLQVNETHHSIIYKIYSNIMKCFTDENCPNLYTCLNNICTHQPITKIYPQTILCLFIIPFLIGLSNRLGISTIWISYPTILVLMCYQFPESLEYMAPMGLAAGFVMLYLALRERSQGGGTGPAVNFYVVNIVMPVLIVSVNIGLVFAQLLPFLYIGIIGCVVGIVFVVFATNLAKDMQANQKISLGHFRKMLPSRLQNSRKSTPTTPTIQLALIQQVDSQIEQHENELSPTRKSKIRQQLMLQSSDAFPIYQFMLCLGGFLGFQCLCLGLPSILGWVGLDGVGFRLGLGYGVGILLMVLGELYLYKYYVEPTKIQEETNKLNLGLRMDGMRMIKICCLGFLGGLLEGMVGFGFSLTLFFCLLHYETPLKNTIATCGFLNIFISTIFTLSSIFCTNNFNWLSFLILFLIALILSSAFQYLFNSYLEGNVQQGSLNSTLSMLIIVVLVLSILSIVLGVSLSWVRFGWEAVGDLGVVGKC